MEGVARTVSDDKQQVLESIRAEVSATLRSLKPTMQGVMTELKNYRRHSHDHEDFLINEFRNVVAAVDRLTATLEKLQ
jgi:hypothetical protein